ncbi:MAG: class I SAM-dependent methyltransferase [Myxococcota bacterium]|nr:class I SAM-dependent methyltransferase [Myxococcota bacterium]
MYALRPSGYSSPSPRSVEVVATDLSPTMIEQLIARADRLERKVDARVMDREPLAFADGAFDHVVLHLILAVLPDPLARACEVGRVLKPGGSVSVFDKFVPDDASPSVRCRAVDLFTNALFHDFTRKLGPMVEAGGLVVRKPEKAIFDFFTIAIAEKPAHTPPMTRSGAK